MRIRLLTILGALVLCLGFAASAQAQTDTPVPYSIVPRTAPTAHVEVAQLPPAGVANFDAEKATDAYMARISPAEKARSDAYFEGGYVLMVVDLLYTLVIAGLLLWLQVSAAMRNAAVFVSQSIFGQLLVYALIAAPVAGILLPLAVIVHLPGITAAVLAIVAVFGLSRFEWVRDMVEKFAASRFLQVPIYVVQYVVVTTVLLLPLSVYEGYSREHAYGLSNQTFWQWAGDFAINSGVALIGLTILLTIVYAIVRATKRYWWVWGSGITVVFMMVAIMVAPVYIAPLTNHYTALPQSGLRSAILSLANANDIPAKDVYTFDASKQSKRVSANVSGLFGTTRISLNDNLLNRGTPSEVLAVLGHEMGHYVMNHVGTFITWFGLLIVLAFWFVDHAFRGLTSILGGNWGVRTIDDPAGLPLVMALISVFFFLATPLTNSIIRTQEIQADIFGLNAARQPDAFATVALKLAEYRKLNPGHLEEIIFFDHPSGRNRIAMAMRWKAEHLNDSDIMAGPISPQ